MGPEPSHAYKSWEQVSGYFDGDGALLLRRGTYTVNLSVSWVDQDRELLEHLTFFLKSKAIASRLSEIWSGGRKYFELTVCEGNNLVVLLEEILPFVDKKFTQVKAAADYLRNRITGDELIAIMNSAIRSGKRSSAIRSSSIPYVKAEGLRLALECQSLRKRNRSLTTGQMRAMSRDREMLGLSYERLGMKYGVSPSTAHLVITKYVLEEGLSS